MKIKIDNFVIGIVGVVLLASFFPASKETYVFLKELSTWAVALLFFMHGVKLSGAAVWSGITHWRMHLLILALTFVLFPVLCWLLSWLGRPLLSPVLWSGFLFLAALPSTVNSSVVFTSSAKGNVAGAVCAASLSSLLGVLLSPFLVGLLMQVQGGELQFFQVVRSILLELMLPFLIGHLLRRFLLPYIEKYPSFVKKNDQMAIFLVVYTAFSKAVSDGLWGKIAVMDFIAVGIISLLLLVAVMFLAMFLSRKFGFSLSDEVAVVFCGSKKSLVNGVPMANIIFDPTQVGLLIIPLMIFHQIQLIASAIMVNYFTQRAKK